MTGDAVTVRLTEAEGEALHRAVVLDAVGLDHSRLYAAVERILTARDGALRARIEALIGGPTPPVFLSDRPNKIVRVQHRDDRLGATVTESMVKVADIVAALAATEDGAS